MVTQCVKLSFTHSYTAAHKSLAELTQSDYDYSASDCVKLSLLSAVAKDPHVLYLILFH